MVFELIGSTQLTVGGVTFMVLTFQVLLSHHFTTLSTSPELFTDGAGDLLFLWSLSNCVDGFLLMEVETGLIWEVNMTFRAQYPVIFDLTWEANPISVTLRALLFALVIQSTVEAFFTRITII